MGRHESQESDTADDDHVIIDSVAVNYAEDGAAMTAQTIPSGEQQIHVLRTHIHM